MRLSPKILPRLPVKTESETRSKYRNKNSHTVVILTETFLTFVLYCQRTSFPVFLENPSSFLSNGGSAHRKDGGTSSGSIIRSSVQPAKSVSVDNLKNGKQKPKRLC